MQLEIITATGKLYSQATTDSPYIARNFIKKHLIHSVQDYTAKTMTGMTIRSSAHLPSLLASSPTIQNEQPFKPTRPPQKEAYEPQPRNPKHITLRTLLKGTEITPQAARRILRKHYGPKNVRYEWSPAEAKKILQVLRKR